jgi:hypothetical protein
LPKRVCYIPRLEHLIMPLLRYGEINHMITRATFGHLGVFCTKWQL